MPLQFPINDKLSNDVDSLLYCLPGFSFKALSLVQRLRGTFLYTGKLIREGKG